MFSKRGKIKYEFGDEELQHPSDVTVTREGHIAVSDCGLLVVKVQLLLLVTYLLIV